MNRFKLLFSVLVLALLVSPVFSDERKLADVVQDLYLANLAITNALKFHGIVPTPGLKNASNDIMRIQGGGGESLTYTNIVWTYGTETVVIHEEKELKMVSYLESEARGPYIKLGCSAGPSTYMKVMVSNVPSSGEYDFFGTRDGNRFAVHVYGSKYSFGTMGSWYDNRATPSGGIDTIERNANSWRLNGGDWTSNIGNLTATTTELYLFNQNGASVSSYGFKGRIHYLELTGLANSPDMELVPVVDVDGRAGFMDTKASSLTVLYPAAGVLLPGETTNTLTIVTRHEEYDVFTITPSEQECDDANANRDAYDAALKATLNSIITW